MTGVFGNIGTGMRHMLEPNVTFGTSVVADRYNARDEYRRNYESDQRAMAGIGAGMGVLTPMVGTAQWARKGMPTYLNTVDIGFKGGYRGAAVVGGLVAGGAATLAAGKQVAWMTQDDGNYGAVGATGGAIGGAAVAGAGGALFARKVGGHKGLVVGAMAGGVGALIGAVRGHQFGATQEVGDGSNNYNKEFPSRVRTSDTFADRAQNFGQSGGARFADTGPQSTGFDFGGKWGKHEKEAADSTKEDHAAYMFAAGGAVTIAGAGAIRSAKGLAQQRADTRAGKIDVIATKFWEKQNDSVKRIAAMLPQKPAAYVRSANGAKMLSVLGVVSILSAAQFPAKVLINDMKTANAKYDPEMPVVLGAGLVGMGLGAAGGHSLTRDVNAIKIARNPRIPKIPPKVTKGAAIVGLALAGSMVGGGLSAGMADTNTTGVATGLGALAGVGLAALFRGKHATLPKGAVAGGMLGAMTSSLYAKPAADAVILPVPTEPDPAV